MASAWHRNPILTKVSSLKTAEKGLPLKLDLIEEFSTRRHIQDPLYLLCGQHKEQQTEGHLKCLESQPDFLWQKHGDDYGFMLNKCYQVSKKLRGGIGLIIDSTKEEMNEWFKKYVEIEFA